MPISFECPTCGMKLKAPESAVGKSLACPGCQTQVTCPEPIYDAEVVGTRDAPAPDTRTSLSPGDAPSTESRHPCPMCGELIVKTAAKCRFCHEVFDPSVERTSGKTPKKRRDGEENLEPLDTVLALLCTGIAFLVGIYWMDRGDPRGLKMIKLIAVLIATCFVLVILTGILEAVLEYTGVR
jgi:predicted RNA-binding Zn-ribbon protein involved in translation (DUF1610 family)